MSLEPGRVYRTRDLPGGRANPTRSAKRLVALGKLQKERNGLYSVPIQSRFGPAPVDETALLDGFLKGEPFVITGPPSWNALGLGSTAMFASTLVYNRRRSGEFEFGGRRFLLRRVGFPENPPPEWFIVDLFQHHPMAGVSTDVLAEGLIAKLRAGRFDANRLLDLAGRYGTKATQAIIRECVEKAGFV